MRKIKKDECTICQEVKEVTDISQLIVIWSSEGFGVNADICLECYNLLAKRGMIRSIDEKVQFRLK